MSRRLVAAGLMGMLGLVGGRARGEGPQDGPPARAVDLPAEVVRRCKAATALVELRALGSGSAVCLSRDGFFVTNNHVVEGVGLGRDVKLVIQPGQKAQREFPARVVKLDEEDDLALLKAAPAPDLVPIPLGADDQLEETMPLVVFGYPFGRMLAADKGFPSVSVNTGSITALRRKGGELSQIQLDASVNPGNSGGPAVDRRGSLIGIIVSGIVAARVNFAIPVSRVRAFLSEPALILREPRIGFAGRTRPRRFEIDAYAFEPRALEGLAVTLSLSEPKGEARALPARREGDRFVAEGPACAPGGAEAEPLLVMHKGRARIQGAVPAGGLAMGGRTFSWREVDSLARDGDVWVVSLVDGRRFAGTPAGLPVLRYGNGRTTALATADRIEVRLEQAPPTEVAYEIQARRGEADLPAIEGRLRIVDAPRGLTPDFDRPVARSEVRQPVVVEAVVPSDLMVGVSPAGLGWFPQAGPPAGMEDERGRYLLVDGRPWYVERERPQRFLLNGQAASLWPILFGLRDGQVRLLWARPEAGGPHDGGLVSFEVHKSPDAGVAIARIRNKAKQPTRVAVAFSFDPPGEVLPAPPPRARPVLESHWPLNDADPLRAADLGPARRDGRSSFAREVPGLRGEAARLDQQPVVFPGVLAVDRHDRFTCTAWIYPHPAGNLTILSRMNNGLRGFDLNYGGTVQAHLISSWDGNAIRVNTVERIEPMEWHHVALTYDGSSRARGLRIYLDGAPGTLEVSHDRLSETIRSEFPFAIGGRERRDYYQGQIDEVRAYDRVLSADEVFALYDLERSNLDPPADSSLNRGLVGYWPLDGPSAEVFEDRSGGGHPGRLVPDDGRIELAAGDGGQALRLDGQTALDCGPVADFERNEPYAFGAWCRLGDGGMRTLLANLDRQDRGRDIFFHEGRIHAHLVSEWEGSALRIVSRSTYPGDAWRHVVCTYDGSSRGAGLRLYVDGSEAPCDISHDSLKTTTRTHGTFRIGSRSNMCYFLGDIDDAFVYGRRLAAGEVRAWFERGRNSSRSLSDDQRRGLLGYWPFEGTGDEAYRDRSGNGHHGRPDRSSGHSEIVPQPPARVGRFRGVGGLDCGQAGDFERTDAFSAGGWYDWEGGPSQTLLSKIHHGGPSRGYSLEYDGDRYMAHLTNDWGAGPENSIAVRTPPIRGTGWRHVMFTYDGRSRAAGLKLYVDGELQKAEVLKDSLTRSIRVWEPFVIGSRLVVWTLFGRAANVRVIPRELDAEEVRRLAAADRPPGLLP